MNNKNIFKYLIIIAIVVLVIVATVLIILNTKVKNPNIQEDVGEEDLPELEIDESIEKIDQINTFSMVEKIVNSNIDSNTTFFATEIYFQEIDVVLAYRLYVFGEIFDIGNQSYQNVFFAIDFDEESSNYKITQKKLDIEQSEYEQIAKSGAQKYLITDNYNGEFLQEDISDNLVVKRYFDYYKMLMITNPEKAYSLLITLIEEYNVKLQSTKVYWEKPAEREAYKDFYKQYQAIQKGKEKNYIEYSKDKQVLFLRNDLKKLRKEPNRYYKIIQFYCAKLVELDAMKNLKNSFISEGAYTKGPKKVKRRGRPKKVVNA